MYNGYYDGGTFDAAKYLEEELGPSLTKKGRVRKRKPKQPRIYFTEDTEDAIVEYLLLTNQDQRNRIYNERIAYGFYKLAENIIHTFKFYYTDTDTIEELKHEVVAFLLEKLHLYRKEKGKAYSYFGTICKNYLMGAIQKDTKEQNRQVSYDDISSDIEGRSDLSYVIDEYVIDYRDVIIKLTNTLEEFMEKENLTENEQKLGYALLEIFENFV